MSNKKWKDYSEAKLSGQWEGWPQPPFDITTLHGVTFNVWYIDPNGHLEGILPDGRTQIATFEYVDINSIVLPPHPSPNKEEGKERELRFTYCSGNKACDEFVIHMEDDDGKWFKTILGGKFARLVFQADIVRKAAACRKMLEELLESWSDEWTEATTERVKQTIKSAKTWTEETSSPAVPEKEQKRIVPEKSYFVAQCEGCGYKASSSEWLGGGQIADTGDYGDTYCPICGHIDCPEAEDDLYTDQTELLKNKVLQLNNKISELEWQLFEAKIPPDQPVPIPQGEIPEEMEGILRELAFKAWMFARNAHRLYPHNKHTFSDYSSTQFKEDMKAAAKELLNEYPNS